MISSDNSMQRGNFSSDTPTLAGRAQECNTYFNNVGTPSKPAPTQVERKQKTNTNPQQIYQGLATKKIGGATVISRPSPTFNQTWQSPRGRNHVAIRLRHPQRVPRRGELQVGASGHNPHTAPRPETCSGLLIDSQPLRHRGVHHRICLFDGQQQSRG
ncbi:unnamed protein product [Ectocarpus sp. 12 AP-2014]